MLLTLVAFFAVLGVLVLVHEWGHFVTARRANIKVDEFGFGLPPRLLGFYKDEEGRWQRVGLRSAETKSTIWSLNWLPLGGFVKIKGEMGEAVQDFDSFAHKSVATRIWVISAGVLMNLVLAVILLSIGFTVGVPQIIEEGKIPANVRVRNEAITTIEVLPNSPAQKAGIAVGDKIIDIDGNKFFKVADLQNYLNQKANQSVQLSLQRQNEKLVKEITPVVLEQTQKAGIGVALIKIGIVSYPWYDAWIYGIKETVRMVGGVIYGFYLIITNLIVSRQLIGDVYGPVGIATLIGDAARLGFLYVLQFTAILSIIIAVINFLPFPALDGGRVLFLLIEAVRGKPVNPRFENAMHNAGFILLMVLLLLVTFRDIARISSGLFGWFGGS